MPSEAALALEQGRWRMGGLDSDLELKQPFRDRFQTVHKLRCEEVTYHLEMK